MKRKEIIVTILSEVTGKSLEQVQETFSMILNTPKLDEELSDLEANKLLEELRKEKEGIRKWAEQGLKRSITKSN